MSIVQQKLFVFMDPLWRNKKSRQASRAQASKQAYISLVT